MLLVLKINIYLIINVENNVKMTWIIKSYISSTILLIKKWGLRNHSCAKWLSSLSLNIKIVYLRLQFITKISSDLLIVTIVYYLKFQESLNSTPIQILISKVSNDLELNLIFIFY